VTAIQSVATSQGDNDSGLFELNFHDERYLPFEYAGAISSWRLELPQAFPQFDYNTITDAVLRIRYTARDGGSAFRSTLEGLLRAMMNAMMVDATNTGLYQGFDVRTQFPNEWYQLTQTGTTTLNLTTDYLPFFASAHKPAIDAVTWIASLTGSPASTSISIDGIAVTLAANSLFSSRCTGSSVKPVLGTASTITAADFAKLQEMTFVVHYNLGP
jgi:Tc toxin complex TcA C-terminal TcB-binding domain